jgi:hypothetical protein
MGSPCRELSGGSLTNVISYNGDVGNENEVRCVHSRGSRTGLKDSISRG